MELAHRAALHAALGDPHRLAIVDALMTGDRTAAELGDLVGIPTNLLAHHLGRLLRTGLVERRRGDADARRRYVTLRHEALEGLLPHPPPPTGTVLFLCTGNSARSPFAAALWQLATGAPAESAGREPARRVHPRAVGVALGFGVDLAGVHPRGYDAVAIVPALVVTVCDRAREHDIPFAAPHVHWSLPDPAARGGDAAFTRVFTEISRRVGTLAGRRHPAQQEDS